ncbi:MAG TPA: hypothetical protein VK633_05685, partial [Verrucomicrobiae bacterium]|nr:hypothetical protein [Verrucomicrobiae bacterium]
MTFLPVVSRELSVLSRHRATYRSRAITALFSTLVMVWLLLISLSTLSFAQLGRSIFILSSSLCFAYALLAGIHATSDSLSEEKREGTLGLLFLTDLKGCDVVLGKLAASSLNAFYALLGTVPMLSLAFLIGGVTLAEIGQMALVLANTMFFSLALGTFISALSINERKAMFASSVTLFLITAVPFVLVATFALLTGPAGWTWLSPLYPFLWLHNLVPKTGLLSAFADSMLFHHLTAWVLLGASSLILPRCITAVPAQRFTRLRGAFHAHLFGNDQKRTRYRSGLLNQNAFLWLASRERAKSQYALGVVLFFVLLYCWIFLWLPTLLYDLPVIAAAIFLGHLLFKVWAASEVCSRFTEDHRSGALELLLCSPLSVQEIVRGQTLALRRIFQTPLAVLVLGESILAFLSWRSGYQKPSPADRAMTCLAFASTLLLDFWALKWVGLWRSLFGTSIERVLLATTGRVLVLPGAIFVLVAGSLAGFRSFQGFIPSFREYLLSAWLV